MLMECWGSLKLALLIAYSKTNIQTQKFRTKNEQTSIYLNKTDTGRRIQLDIIVKPDCIFAANYTNVIILNINCFNLLMVVNTLRL